MRQKYGQHFLTDTRIIHQIVEAVLLLRKGPLVEIGPGKGALTLEIIARGLTPFTVVEIDPEMVSYLQTHLPKTAAINILQENFLKFDLNTLPATATTFVSNLPYQDAAAILDKVLAWPYFSTAVFMFQKEHTQKIRAKTGEEFYGPLSIFSQLRARISLIAKVGRTSFSPPPKVESAVLAFEKIEPPDLPWEKLRRVVAASFLHRRKTLLNALLLAGYDKEKITTAINTLRWQPTIRPEEISPQEYVCLTRQLERLV